MCQNIFLCSQSVFEINSEQFSTDSLNCESRHEVACRLPPPHNKCTVAVCFSYPYPRLQHCNNPECKEILILLLFLSRVYVPYLQGGKRENTFSSRGMRGNFPQCFWHRYPGKTSLTFDSCAKVSEDLPELAQPIVSQYL